MTQLQRERQGLLFTGPQGLGSYPRLTRCSSAQVSRVNRFEHCGGYIPSLIDKKYEGGYSSFYKSHCPERPNYSKCTKPLPVFIQSSSQNHFRFNPSSMNHFRSNLSSLQDHFQWLYSRHAPQRPDLAVLSLLSRCSSPIQEIEN